MQRLLSLIFIVCLSPVLILAQSTCPALDEIIVETLDTCDTLEANLLCTASENIEVTSDSQDSITLSEISIIEAIHEDDETPSFVMQLNREDHTLLLLGIGGMSITNTAPRSEITVTATRNVNLRRMPSVDASAIGSMTIRENYTAIGRVADNTWVQIRLDDGRMGWASAQYFITEEGYEALQAVTPSAPAYLPMQAFELSTGDCGTLLLIAPEIEDESIIFGVNGAQIAVTGIVSLSTEDNMLMIDSIVGQHSVNTFGFEIDLAAEQSTTIPLSDSGTIAGIATELEVSNMTLGEEAINDLLPSE